MLGVAERFHLAPSAARRESAEVLRLMEIRRLGHPEREEGDDDG